ncbi:uncharacterized protein LACBIDRAFT_309558 [Laccaria bicolor S238N-H82]|uniref:Predicted protein n=1 Tax=Laccaria bicolor (strain S238N-H82 / ATCC MYA-4686) TaxID=486041 RepID=B0DSK7_LACBS|nr:uncharacterized protein LACBIDRAFT_309558 [Laccaria bicolor S238N-H82]EDR02566.1 predicted protein [Laccaria bicolor S238N-H82]|eukprot:XP_001886929.1 predicted protein [Laccaria bicolor S238N-H82]
MLSRSWSSWKTTSGSSSTGCSAGVGAPSLFVPEDSGTCSPASGAVFKGSVQSGFLPRKRATVDRNRSRTNPDIEGTEPNHLGPVFCSP